MRRTTAQGDRRPAVLGRCASSHTAAHDEQPARDRKAHLREYLGPVPSNRARDDRGARIRSSRCALKGVVPSGRIPITRSYIADEIPAALAELGDASACSPSRSPKVAPMGDTTERSVERAPGTVLELGHIVLYVASLSRSLEFYRDVLRWPVILNQAGLPAVGFRAGNTHHDLLLIEAGPDAQPVAQGRRLGLYHFGVKVGDSDDDLRAVKVRLEARPDLTEVVGAVDGGFVHSLYVHDPDGNELELYVDIPGWDWDDPDLLAKAPREPLRL